MRKSVVAHQKNKFGYTVPEGTNLGPNKNKALTEGLGKHRGYAPPTGGSHTQYELKNPLGVYIKIEPKILTHIHAIAFGFFYPKDGKKPADG